eukprot:TRINITY_DN6508_c0_g4_i1.p1 TRINITY_DN6508_c0_g4~~TRINITY_DN6508_c0_g4_i1.p1  ORF type:complete len:153 (+),score=21.32 TRINITY_DN6508_c0_g4_i1:52-510(+)
MLRSFSRRAILFRVMSQQSPLFSPPPQPSTPDRIRNEDLIDLPWIRRRYASTSSGSDQDSTSVTASMLTNPTATVTEPQTEPFVNQGLSRWHDMRSAWRATTTSEQRRTRRTLTQHERGVMQAEVGTRDHYSRPMPLRDFVFALARVWERDM